MASAANKIVALSRSPDSHDRIESLETITEASESVRVEVIARLLADPDPLVRNEALASIWRFSALTPTTRQMIVGRLSEEPEDWVLCTAAEEAAFLNVTEAIPRLRDLLDHPSDIVRGWSSRALGLLGGSAELAYLSLVEDDSEFVAVCLIVARARLGDQSALPELATFVTAPGPATLQWVVDLLEDPRMAEITPDFLADLLVAVAVAENADELLRAEANQVRSLATR